MLASSVVIAARNPDQDFVKKTKWFIFVFLCTSLLWFLVESYNSYVIPSIQEFVRDKIIHSSLDVNKKYEPVSIGSKINNMARIPNLVYLQMISISFYIFPFFFTFLFLSFYFFRYGVEIGVIFLSMVVMASIVFGYWFLHNIKVSMTRYDEELSLSDSFDDILLNTENILNENLKDVITDDFKQKQSILSDKIQKELMAINAWKQTLDAIIMITMGVIIAVGYALYKRNKMPLALFTSLITLIIFVINKIISLINRIGDLPYIIGSIQQTQKVLENVPNMQGQRKDFIENFDIDLDNVWYGYEDDKYILKGVNMKIPSNTTHLIRGDSGSGKTTLCKCLMGYFKPQKGTILIDNVPIEEIDILYLRDNITFMLQNGFLFDTTGQDNISRDTDIIQRVHSMPIYPKIKDILERKTGKLGSRLSGGERQIILLLRALFRPCRLLILDEPTSNIDEHNKIIVLDIIKELCKTKTVICITHDNDLERYFDNIYYLKHGVIKSIHRNNRFS
jgi:ABC-type bacteriocin/lantibiotic exporter with double-glycine peptidase domain